MKQKWMKSVEITSVYRVGVEKLEQFAARGNLGIKKNALGQRLYNSQDVARIFPRRDAMSANLLGNCLGYLGESRLAEVQQISVLPTRAPAIREVAFAQTA